MSNSLTLRYDKVMFILDPTERATALAGKKVVVCDYPDGRLEITDGRPPCPTEPSTRYGPCIAPEVVENKRLDDMLSIVAELQAGRQQQRSKSGPRPDWADGSYVRHPRWQPEQRLSEARHQARTENGFYEGSCRYRPTAAGVGGPACCRVM